MTTSALRRVFESSPYSASVSRKLLLAAAGAADENARAVGDADAAAPHGAENDVTDDGDEHEAEGGCDGRRQDDSGALQNVVRPLLGLRSDPCPATRARHRLEANMAAFVRTTASFRRHNRHAWMTLSLQLGSRTSRDPTGTLARRSFLQAGAPTGTLCCWMDDSVAPRRTICIRNCVPRVR